MIGKIMLCKKFTGFVSMQSLHSSSASLMLPNVVYLVGIRHVRDRNAKELASKKQYFEVQD